MKKKNSILPVVLITASAVLAIATISVKIKTNELQKEYDLLKSELDALDNKIAEMEYDLSLSEDEFMDKYLRDVLGYHKSDEIIFRNEN